MRQPATPALLMTALAALAPLGACSTLHTSGFEIDNSTDRIVHVELLRLDKGGEMHPYARQALSPGGHYKHKVDEEEFKRGLRARFTLEGEAVDEGNWVMLQLGKGSERRYDLQLINGRLTARDASKMKRPPGAGERQD
jgi:hypothetical protein